MKAVVFDLGRVLVHYDHALTLAGVQSVCAGSPEVVHTIMEESHVDLESGALSSEEFHARLREKAGAIDDDAAFEAAFTAGISRDDDALAYALELESRDDVQVAVISNTTEVHVRWLDLHVPELRQFDLVMMSNEIGMRKPDPAVFRLALELLDIAPDKAIFVDDVPANVEGAVVLGMAGLLHTDWRETRPALEAWLAE